MPLQVIGCDSLLWCAADEELRGVARLATLFQSVSPMLDDQNGAPRPVIEVAKRRPRGRRMMTVVHVAPLRATRSMMNGSAS